jgi:hypothetical protein
MELSPVGNYLRGTGPAFAERFRYEPVIFNYTSLSMHFDPILTVFFHWLGELASAPGAQRCHEQAVTAARIGLQDSPARKAPESVRNQRFASERLRGLRRVRTWHATEINLRASRSRWFATRHECSPGTDS